MIRLRIKLDKRDFRIGRQEDCQGLESITTGKERKEKEKKQLKKKRCK